MRLAAILACVLVAQCASGPDPDDEPRAYVVIGLAEAGANTSPRYTMLWRRLDETGHFMRYGGGRIIELRTESGESTQAPGIPGEFFITEAKPGTYALDSVFATIQDGSVSYIAGGLIAGPERPGFELAEGEAVYLGIWETNLNADMVAVAKPWRLEQRDLDTVLARADADIGSVRMIEPRLVSAPCAPRRLNARSQRQVC